MQDILVRMIEMTTDFAADGAVCILDKALAVSAIGFAHQSAYDFLVVTVRLLLTHMLIAYMTIILLLFPAHDYLATVPRTLLSGYCSRT